MIANPLGDGKSKSDKMSDLTIDVELERIVLAYVVAPFDEAKALLNENGYRVISLEENVLLRMLEGRDSIVSTFGNWTREGFVYVPKKGVFLVRNSPVLDDAEKATEANRNGMEFYSTKDQVERALEDSVLIPFKSPINMPTNKFGDDDITAFAFGEQAKVYGEFLRDTGIEEMPICLVDRDYVNDQSKPFVRQLLFFCLDYRSELCGYSRGLDCNNRVRGIKGSKGMIQKPKYINPWEIEIPEIEK